MTLLQTEVSNTGRQLPGELRSPLLKSGVMLQDFHSSGTLPEYNWSNNAWKSVKAGAIGAMLMKPRLGLWLYED
jgi:hypothetical protein